MWAVLLALDDELCKDDSHGCGLACASNPELHSLFVWRIDDEFARIVIVNCCGQNSAYIASVCDFGQPECPDHAGSPAMSPEQKAEALG